MPEVDSEAPTEKMERPPHQQRVFAERDELADRVERLGLFLEDKEKLALVPQAERRRLRTQLQAMVEYLSILDQRISNNFE